MAINDTAYSNAVLDWYWAGQSVTPPSAFYIGLATNNGDGFTEQVGGGYARQVISFGTANNGVVQSNVTVTFGPASSSWTAQKFGIFLASSGGTPIMSKLMEPLVFSSGVSKLFLSGSIEIQLG